MSARRRINWLLGSAAFLALYALLIVYPAARLLTWSWPELPLALALPVLLAPPIAFRWWLEKWPSPTTRAATRLGMTLVGFCFMAWLPVLALDLAALIAPIDLASVGPWLAVILVLIGVYACWNALHIRVRDIDITLHDETHSTVRGKRIAHVSDLHIGSLHPRQLTRTVERLAAINADFNVLTGDIVDFRDIPATDLAPLAQLRAPTIFIIGNHERYVDVEEICARIRSHGVTVLRNASTEIDGVQFIGIDDAERKDQVERMLATGAFTPEPQRFRVLLYHRPDGAEAAASWGAHLMLSGHTHNGQIVPFNYLVKRYFPRISGLHHVDGMQLFVSTGTGVWGPVLRLGSGSEICVHHLV